VKQALIVATATAQCFTRCDERAGPSERARAGPKNPGHVWTKISRRRQTTRLSAWDRSRYGPRSTKVRRLICGGC
jgi:hypothetical protein